MTPTKQNTEFGTLKKFHATWESRVTDVIAYVATPHRFNPFVPMSGSDESSGYQTANFLFQRTADVANLLKVPGEVYGALIFAGAAPAAYEAFVSAPTLRTAIAEGLQAGWESIRAAKSGYGGAATISKLEKTRFLGDTNTYWAADSVDNMAKQVVGAAKKIGHVIEEAWTGSERGQRAFGLAGMKGEQAAATVTVANTTPAPPAAKPVIVASAAAPGL